MSVAGVVFRKTLNAIAPKYSKGFASPLNKGFAKFVNGTQHISGNTHVFQFGLKHKIVATCYRDSMNEYIRMAHGASATGAELNEIQNRIPKMFHQALAELADWTARGGNIPL